MAIDINVEIKAGFFQRWMSVGQMKKCLAQLEDTDILYPSRVGNLAVVRDSDRLIMIGYIDFNEEQFESVQ
ncbi:hypothetical protein KA005_35850 [bacterium]|nr:hypothetical protein [bacterium]